MNTYVNVGSSKDFLLRRALLVYGESSYDGFPYRHPFVTVHDVKHEDGQARFGAGTLVTPGLLASLIKDLGQSVPIEILPECTLVRTAEMIVWWSPASTRTMYFVNRGGDKGLHDLSGKQYPHPPLLFKASGSYIWIRALAENKRPVAETKLHMAPYWNCYDNAVVCTGSTNIPQQKSVAAIQEWERWFFQSAFSHAAGVTKHTKYRAGLLAMWKSLQGKKQFPTKYLVPVKQNLQQFVASNDTSYGIRQDNHA
jgi:PRTRC genetic system protein B